MSTRSPFISLDVHLSNLCHNIRQIFLSEQGWLHDLCIARPRDKARSVCGHDMNMRTAFEHHVAWRSSNAETGPNAGVFTQGKEGGGGGGAVPKTKRGIVLLYTMGRWASYPYCKMEIAPQTFVGFKAACHKRFVPDPQEATAKTRTSTGVQSSLYN